MNKNSIHFFNSLIILLLISLFQPQVFAQHEHSTSKTDNSPMSFHGVFGTFLSDPELKDYKLESSIMTVAPGHADTVAHRHDCELFGYVIEGKLEIGLDKQAPVTYNSGQMFYEKRNILHSLAKNPDNSKPAKVLLIFIIKNGRQGYIKAYPEEKK